MKHNKIFLISLITIILCLFITGCQKNNTEQPTTNNETETILEENSENKFLLIDTENYKIKMDIFGDWKTYSGQTELKDNTIAFLIPEDTLTDSPYFYITVEKYNNKDNLPVKDYIVNILNEKYTDLELESVYEYEDPKRVKLIYSISNTAIAAPSSFILINASAKTSLLHGHSP